MASQCDLCAYYWIDEEDGTGECHGAFPLSSTSTSAYVLSYIHRPSGNTDSYLMSRTTSLPDHPHPNSPDSVYRRVSLDGIVKEQIKEVMEVAEQMSEEVLQELEKSFCNTI